MAITRTPIIDDNGTGTTGTILNNAWKQELYGQIDAQVAGLSGTVLAKANGLNTATGVATLGTVVMPGLGTNDYVTVVIDIYQYQQTGGQILLQAIGDTTLVQLDNIGGGSLTPGVTGLWTVTLRMIPTVNPLGFQVLAVGGAGTVGGIRIAAPFTTAASWTAGGWTLGFLNTGQPAGGQQFWGWSVQRS